MFMSPLAAVIDEKDTNLDKLRNNDVEETEAIWNTAETHAKTFRDMFNFFGLTLEDCVVCQTGDNDR